MATKQFRKITVGDNFSNCIAYVKTIKYLGRSVEITDIIEEEENKGYIDIYVTADDGRTTVIWKTIPYSKVIEFEYDVNFK
ncbi:hypothetical protein Phi40:1_gp088 [Cellulophaga phage phi40:1]|uniref:Uncharacterized protein n=1 Tax=Cellulophaga phage phi38:1 TaxID=1327977 RepID=S0A1Q1_9CAUD|nr:hypothetical protein Phi38:1_gp088 [Cellulophaga phage phi38:1]AGO47953.1 hypothetical protein Phi40:1_gp088 [Cellulophaga phage phi40:1]AGO48118.1 hypothetical protein Phi38:1_gp088 [Cellulophaga phage phi38:1]